MTRCLFLLFLVAFSINSYGQKSLESGYFIDNSNNKTTCYIQNIGWLDSPTQFKYKTQLEGSLEIKTITEVKEFAIGNTVKFERHKVMIDRSSEKVSEMSNQINPVFNEETLFLKVLVEGNATLYSYGDKDLYRYFYKTDDGVKQLVFKSYVTDDDQIKENNSYKGQLWDNIKVSGLSEHNYKKIDYEKKDLITLFEQYNADKNSNYTIYKQKNAKGKLNITLRPGINQQSFEVSNSLIIWKSMRFDNETSFRMGVELEYILPFNTNKWGIVLEPTFSSYKSEKTIPSNSLLVTGRVDYKSIEFPVSLRHYFFLNENNSFFINASIIVDTSFDSSLTITRSNGTVVNKFDVASGVDYALGGGFKTKNKYSIEARYSFSKNLIATEGSWNSKLSIFAVIVGYTLF
ncbi:porin family protein [Hyunsoonleella pacifica]|uniref:tRNA modification GTPase n=1 Tax=Hyunsoonleella pacifica TaxID=1080224 RepID=A0A4Q9FPQ7_9FLAO|nr:tRNA modification GTPase [Hyunsoonleella pacifica]TBN16709.1 tRNA modification GTPase [Hyunsoonleella pacifica]GGD17093.1 hypothetical protein GCM10011368_18850 [Hyunsoonleella pacifica]